MKNHRYKHPQISPEIIDEYNELCQKRPMNGDTLSARVKLLKDIMDQRRKSIQDHYHKESGQAQGGIGRKLDLKG